jgi:carboxyl-terminal processing protease
MDRKSIMKSALLLCLATLGYVVALAQAPATLSQTQAEAYASIGRVWGFLKYYHPAVATRTYNWDSVLIAALPKDSSVMDVARGQQVIDRLLAVAGPVPDCQVCPPAFDSAQAVNVDWGWMEENTLLRSGQMAQLQRIRDQHEPGENGYIGKLFETKANWQANKFLMDAGYQDISAFDYRHRLMAAFHYWSVIEYFFPYKSSANPYWDKTLSEAVPRFVQAGSDHSFQLAMLWLANQPHDSHANGSFSNYLADNWYGNYRFPFSLRAVEDSMIVVDDFFSDSLAQLCEIQAGDQIVAIDGQSIWSYMTSKGHYIGASHQAAKLNYMLLYAIMSIDSSSYLTFIREGDTIQEHVHRYLTNSIPWFQVRQDTWEWVGASQNMLLARVSQMSSSQEARRLVRRAKQAEGIILDLRSHQLWSEAFMTLFEVLQPAEPTFTWHFSPSYDYPGFLGPSWQQELGAGNPRRKKLKQKAVVLLIGKNVLSQTEFLIMHLQTHPKAYSIGSRTGGALAAIGRIYLPGGFRANFTQHGMTYADGTPIFGCGVKLDETIIPTQADIRTGRDPVLERAIEYLNEQL